MSDLLLFRNNGIFWQILESNKKKTQIDAFEQFLSLQNRTKMDCFIASHFTYIVRKWISFEQSKHSTNLNTGIRHFPLYTDAHIIRINVNDTAPFNNSIVGVLNAWAANVFHIVAKNMALIGHFSSIKQTNSTTTAHCRNEYTTSEVGIEMKVMEKRSNEISMITINNKEENTLLIGPFISGMLLRFTQKLLFFVSLLFCQSSFFLHSQRRWAPFLHSAFRTQNNRQLVPQRDRLQSLLFSPLFQIRFCWQLSFH